MKIADYARADLHHLNDLDCLILKPALLMVVTILSAIESADFLYLQRETGYKVV